MNINKVDNSKQEVINSIQSISAISEEAAEAAEEISAIIQEYTVSMAHIQETAKNLTDVVDKLE
ncbi:hypothetical protein HBE96_09265 [Clostridium sp. P21]|uniref:Methyl-accepting chemotaxis protein n=1 Tax=Clostridium muellerianum TaxID=2716538 RepID=A0A7Y0EGC9_9CLOT|nr:hypothetical protein [Clostridium muellerianum]NMM62886.1 hypothetical protein [Clostridium muellerianum]